MAQNAAGGLGDLVGLIVLVLLGSSSLLVLLGALLPGYVERTRSTMRMHPGRSFLLGLVNVIFFLAVAWLLNVPFAPLQLLGGLSFLLVLPALLVLGLLVAGSLVGEQVWGHFASQPGRLLISLLIGNAVLLLTLLVPIVGWLLFLAVVLTGIGAAITALFSREKHVVAVSG